MSQEYLEMKARGAYCGSSKEPTWDKTSKTHACCGSRHPSYHKRDCRSRSTDLSDLAEPVDRSVIGRKALVQRYKARGYSSGDALPEVRRIFPDMTLSEINRLWV